MRAGAAREVCVVGGGATQDARETRNKCASKNLCEQKVRAKMCEQKVPQFKPKTMVQAILEVPQRYFYLIVWRGDSLVWARLI